MSLTLTLTGSSSELKATYFPPLELHTQYVLGLVDFNTYNSIPNVDYSNNLFHIGAHIIEVPIGSYEISDIIEYITDKYEKILQKDDMINKKKSTALDVNVAKQKENLVIKTNNNTLQVEIYSEFDRIHFDKNRSIGTLLGFDKQLDAKKWHSSSLVNILKVNVIRIECNVVTGSFINNSSAHTIHEFSLNVMPGYKIIETPHNVIYLPVNTRRISSITVKVVDQDDNLINFRGETITLRLHLKPQI